MKSSPMLLGILAAAVVLSLFIADSMAAPPQTPSPREVVSPTAYVSADPVARGKVFQLAVVAKIRPGFHINAREKSAEYLIATDLKADVPAGFQAGEVSYPKGTLQNFSFSKIPLNVYQNTVTLRMPLTAHADAPVGTQHIPLKLRYQACSAEICLPPVTLSLDATVNVTDSAESKPTHPEIFPPQ